MQHFFDRVPISIFNIDFWQLFFDQSCQCVTTLNNVECVLLCNKIPGDFIWGCTASWPTWRRPPDAEISCMPSDSLHTMRLACIVHPCVDYNVLNGHSFQDLLSETTQHVHSFFFSWKYLALSCDTPMWHKGYNPEESNTWTNIFFPLSEFDTLGWSDTAVTEAEIGHDICSDR